MLIHRTCLRLLGITKHWIRGPCQIAMMAVERNRICARWGGFFMYMIYEQRSICLALARVENTHVRLHLFTAFFGMIFIVDNT